MISRRAMLGLAPAAAAAIALPRRSFAEPVTGGTFPSFSAHDLMDLPHTTREMRGHRVFVSVITGTGASDPMRMWLDNAESRLGRARGNIYALVALHLGFYAWDGIVRSRARAGTPAWRWSNVWLDRDGTMQRILGVPNDSSLPWAFVIEPNGVVSAAAHAAPTHPSAQQVWAAMLAH